MSFIITTLGKTGIKVHPLGLSATYLPGKKAIRTAADEGINFFFCFGIDYQMIGALRELLRTGREKFVVATGGGNLIITSQNLRKSLENRLRKLGIEYVDIFYYLGVTKEKYFPDRVRDELLSLKETGKVRYVGISTHDRKLAGKLAAEGTLDVMMIRYNAAHRGAETDIFPLMGANSPALVSFTATSWTHLLRRPRGWPKDGQVPTAGQCYRFVLSNPNVSVCMNAPKNEKQLVENIRALEKGPMSVEEMSFMRSFGDAVYKRKKWFM